MEKKIENTNVFEISISQPLNAQNISHKYFGDIETNVDEGRGGSTLRDDFCLTWVIIFP